MEFNPFVGHCTTANAQGLQQTESSSRDQCSNHFSLQRLSLASGSIGQQLSVRLGRALDLILQIQLLSGSMFVLKCNVIRACRPASFPQSTAETPG